MICPNCKSEIADSSVFCVNCGCKVAAALQNSANQAAVNLNKEANQALNQTAAGTAQFVGNQAQNNPPPAQPYFTNATANPQAPQGFQNGFDQTNNSFSQNYVQNPDMGTAQNNVNMQGGFVPNADMGNVQNNVNMQGGFNAAPQGYVAPTKPKPKKSIKKALPFIIGGGVLALGIGAFCCFKFAAADIAHTFMGDEKYAATLAKGTVSSVTSNSFIDSTMTSSLSSALSTGNNNSDAERYEQFVENNPDTELSYSQYRQIESIGDMLSALGRQLPENGIYIKSSSKTELTDKFYELFTQSAGEDTDAIRKAFEALNSFNGEVKLSVKNDGIDAGYLISNGNDTLDSGTAFYNAEEGNLYYSNPSVYGSALRIKLVPISIDVGAGSDNTDTAELEKKRAELVSKIIDIYSEHLEEAETEFVSVTEPVGENEFKGKCMKVTFDTKSLASLLKDIVDEFLKSDYFKSVIEAAFGENVPESFDIDDLIDSADNYFERMADSGNKVSFTVEHFINADNSVAGLRLSFSSKESGSKKNMQASFFNINPSIYGELKVNGTSYVKIEGKTSSDNAGTMDITLNNLSGRTNENKKLKIALEYNDLGTKELFGQKQILGNFKISLSGTVLNDLNSENGSDDIVSFIKKSVFSFTAADKESGIEYQLGFTNESYGNMSVLYEIGENTEVILDRAGMTEDASVDLSSDSTEIIDVQIGALKHLQDVYNGSDLMKLALGQSVSGNFIEQAQAQIDALEKNKKYIAVYKDYDENTVYNANSIANEIYYNLYSYDESRIKLNSKDPVTLKVYFDSEGVMNTIDLAGESDSLLDDIKSAGYKNTYVEIIYYKAINKYSPVGVTAVMTDNKDNHGDSLPSVYNYLDSVYPWEEVNYIGNFVVGTYPTLDTGESTYEQNLKDLANSVAAFNGYAEKGLNAINSYLKENNNSFDFSNNYYKNTYIAFKIDSGKWSNYNNVSKYNFKNDDIELDSLYKYMATKVPEIKDGYFYVYISNNKAIGASCSETSYLMSTAAFICGYTNEWSMLDGVVQTYSGNGYIIGTSPAIKSYDGSLSEKIKKLMIGTWVNKYDDKEKITITEADISHITDIQPDSVEYMRITLKFGDETKYYYFNFAGQMEFEYDTYIKK